jgi:hypothetical protein
MISLYILKKNKEGEWCMEIVTKMKGVPLYSKKFSEEKSSMVTTPLVDVEETFHTLQSEGKVDVSKTQWGKSANGVYTCDTKYQISAISLVYENRNKIGYYTEKKEECKLQRFILTSSHCEGKEGDTYFSYQKENLSREYFDETLEYYQQQIEEMYKKLN